jgi:hypothetical protein
MNCMVFVLIDQILQHIESFSRLLDEAHIVKKVIKLQTQLLKSQIMMSIS